MLTRNRVSIGYQEITPPFSKGNKINTTVYRNGGKRRTAPDNDWYSHSSPFLLELRSRIFPTKKINTSGKNEHCIVNVACQK